MLRFILFAVAASAFAASLVSTVYGETLGAVLAAHNIPANTISEREQQKPITSFAVSDDRSPFLLAYYDDDGSGALKSLLHIVRYDRTDGLRRVNLRGKNLPFRGFGEMMKEPSSNCMGSALRISEKNGVITIDTHISPSAGCVLVLDSDLRFSAGLWGWTIGRIDGQLIVEESMVHFAATHPGRLAAYDPRSKQLTHIYPANDDANRKGFSEELKQHLPSREWCQQSNNPCDAMNFTTDITHVIIDERGKSFAFDAQMNPEGFGEDAERAVRAKTAHYICRWIDNRWVLTFG